MGCGSSTSGTHKAQAGRDPEYFALPQHDTKLPADQRRAAVAEQAKEYDWSYALGTDIPPFVAEVPAREKDRAAAFQKFGITLDFLKVSTTLKINAIADAGLEKISGEEPPFQDYTDILNRAASTVKVPVCAAHWRTDREFGWQRMNGVNPTLIRCLTQLPAKFPVGQDPGVQQTLQSRGEPSFPQLLAARRVFVCDYEMIDKLDTPPERRHLAPILCCYLDKEDHMMPLAIQLDQTPGPAAPIFSPADLPNVWLAAKTHVATAEAQQHEVVAHLVSTHIVMEATWTAAMRTMHVTHPIVEFMKPHMWFTLSINHDARKGLINEGGPIDLSFNMGYKGQVQLLMKSCKDWHWKRFDIPLSVERRDIGFSQGRLSEYHWRDDALALWDVILRYVTKMFGIFYKTDAEVEADTELQAWIHVLVADADTKQGCGFHGLPGFDDKANGKNKLTTREELNRLLTMIIFNVSAGHAAVNNGQYEFMGYIPNMPATFKLPPQALIAAKASGTDLGLKAIEDAMPKGDRLSQQIAIVVALSGATCDPIGSYEMDFFVGHMDAWTAIEEFRRDLRQQTQNIRARNNAAGQYRPYFYMDPAQMAQGISI